MLSRVQRTAALNVTNLRHPEFRGRLLYAAAFAL